MVSKLKLAVEQLEVREVLTSLVPNIFIDAGTANDGLDTPADVIHPNIHKNNGPGENANPNGNDNRRGDGGNIHGIGNNPGQNDQNPNADGVPGFANQLNTVHGGL